MKEDEKEERLHELQGYMSDFAKGIKRRYWDKDALKVADLLLLLVCDPTIHKLIRDIATEQGHAAPAPAASDSAKDNASAETRAAAEEDEEDDNAGFGSLPPAPAEPLAPAARHEPPARNEWHERREPSASLFGLWPTPAPEPVPVPAPVDPLRQQLAPELALLAQVQADAELAALLIGHPATGDEQADETGNEAEADAAEATEGRQLARLLARAAQWDVVQKLWDALAMRCKQKQAPATPAELNALQMAVALHNLRWQDRQARLLPAEAGERYNFEAQQRGNKGSGGDTIRALWLPGLQSANGEQSRKALVEVA